MPLKNHIKSLIKHNGPINVALFMAEALSHPEHGYYNSHEPFGKEGDFTTAPEISQIFGEMIGVWAAYYWQQTGCKKAALVEIGGGRGTLMHDLLRATKNVKGFHDAVSVHMVETSKRLTKIQQEKLADSHSDIKWYKNFDDIPDKPLILIANELFDALPIHQYCFKDGKWFEKMVGLDDNGEMQFCLMPSPIDLPKSDNVPENAVLEISPASVSLIKSIASRIKNSGGAAIIIDYGYDKSTYKNTLQSLKKHSYNYVLDNIGHADITAHVDFGTLKQAAMEEGADVTEIMTQSEFLNMMGADIRAKNLIENATKKQQDDIKSALHRLISDEQMGSLFKVMVVC